MILKDLPRQGYLIEESPSLSDWYCCLRADFKCLEKEVSLQTEQLAMLSKDVQDVVFSSLLRMLSDREALYDLMSMVRIP